MRLFVHCVGLLLLVPVFGGRRGAVVQSETNAASPYPTLTAEEIVSRMVGKNLERARALGAYEGTRIYRLDYRGFPGSRSAKMIVNVKYRAPGTKEFTVRSEKGSKVIIDRVFKRMLQTEKEAVSQENQNRVALNQDNYRFTLAGEESAPTGRNYVLSVEPRTDDKLLYRGRVWVDSEDFAVARIEATPAKNPSFWTKETKIEQISAKVDKFWLPLSNRSSSEIRMGGHANFTIDYQDYQITAIAPLNKTEALAGGK